MGNRRRKPALTPLQLSDEDLDRMSEPTEADIINANRDWEEAAKNKELLKSADSLDIEDEAQ